MIMGIEDSLYSMEAATSSHDVRKTQLYCV
jgi:hypothetical protein